MLVAYPYLTKVDIFMIVRLVSRNREETFPNISHITRTDRKDGSAFFELSRPGIGISESFNIPEDGYAVYMMNDSGDTVDSFRYNQTTTVFRNTAK